MSSKLGLKLTRYYSINFDLPKRHKKFIKFIIIHYTGMKKQSEALKKLCDSKSKVSCHYFIKNNGQIIQIVPDLFIAWHAGVSFWTCCFLCACFLFSFLFIIFKDGAGA